MLEEIYWDDESGLKWYRTILCIGLDYGGSHI